MGVSAVVTALMTRTVCAWAGVTPGASWALMTRDAWTMRGSGATVVVGAATVIVVFTDVVVVGSIVVLLVAGALVLVLG